MATVSSYKCGQTVKKSGSYANCFRNGRPTGDTPCDLFSGDPFAPTSRPGLVWRLIGAVMKPRPVKKPRRYKCPKCGHAFAV
jgi:hypothetical protein